MPIDPTIISQGMANMPDVNALLQQQISGMENINALERQRRGDELVMQDRAAAAAKEQEDAAVKALLPAYAHAFKTGDLKGAGNLAPPEMRPQLQPYIDALEGKSLEEIQAALTGSLVTSEVGRAFLENMNRAAITGIQQGQLEVSREDIKLRRQKQALDARGEGEWKLEPGEDENGVPMFVWTNPRTRQIVKADVTGGAAPGPAPIPAPDAVTPRAPAPGAPEVAAPISTAQPPKEFRPKAKKEGADKGLTEYQGKAVQHATSMAYADKITTELEKEGVITPDAVSNAILGVVRSVPLQAGANLANELEYGLNAILPGLTPEEQRLARAQLAFVTAILRSESGAEIKASEFPAEYRKYFAVAGDENNQKLLEEKKTQRRIRIASMREAAGEEGRKAIDRVLSEQGVTDTAAPAAPAAPAVTPIAPGATKDGFEYQGVVEE